MTTIRFNENNPCRYEIVADNKILGRTYDNKSEKIVVNLPEFEKTNETNCYMIVTDAKKQVIGKFLIKDKEEFALSSDITQNKLVYVGFNFEKADYNKGSNIDYFKFLEAMKPVDFEPEPTEKDPVKALLSEGFVDGYVENNKLVFLNLSGNVVKKIELSGFVQEQSDLREEDSTKETFIKGKEEFLYPLNQGIINNAAAIAATNKDVATLRSELEEDIAELDEDLETVSNEQAEHDAEITAIQSKIPNQATSTNQLADKNFVNSSIEQSAANRVTYNAQGDPFPTYSSLSSATEFYNAGVAYTPDKHDYCIIEQDERYEDSQTRNEYDGTVWAFAYKINDKPFTAAETASLESGITAEKVAEIGLNTSARHTHPNKTILDNTTASFTTQDKTSLDGKADSASVNQEIDAINAKIPSSASSTNKLQTSKPNGTTSLIDENNKISAEYLTSTGIQIVFGKGETA